MKRYLLITAMLLSGCIKNDIPYPLIIGAVTEFSAVGQKECAINAETRTITLVMSDTIDMNNVAISSMVITPEDAKCNLDISLPINLSTPLSFVITTYQEYQWKIEATQPIERDVQVENQVGTANIDPSNKKVMVYVAKDQPLSNIVVKKMLLGPSNSTISPDPSTVTDFSTSQTFTVKYRDITEEWVVYVQQSESNAITGGVSPWACFAMVEGSILAGLDQACGFDYKASEDTEWKSVEVTPEGGKISGKIPGLKPATSYLFRAFQGTDKGMDVAFVTQQAPTILNMGMEDWGIATASGKTWITPWSEGQTPYWASGNQGVETSGKPSNTVSTDDAHQGKAAKLETVAVPMVNIAAGNLFSGEFVLTMLEPLNSPKFGRPYTGRPTSLSFWYKCDPKTINVSKDPAYMGKPDKCIVYMYLGKWGKPLLSSELKGLQTPGVIAYGEMVSDKAVKTYTKHTIQLQYVDLITQPTDIIIVATSSIYGDKYIGGIGSTLFVDDFEFGWE